MPKRNVCEENVNNLITELLSKDWQYLVSEDDANMAYDELMAYFMKQYDKHCPVKYVQ